MAFDGGFGIILGFLREHMRHMGVTLGPFWAYFGVILGSLWVSVGNFGSVDGYFAMIVESIWVYEDPFAENKHFPHRF